METLHWILLLIVVIGLALIWVRFDVLVARWRELTTPAPDPTQVAAHQEAPQHGGMRPHDAPSVKPPIHRSGKRH